MKTKEIYIDIGKHVETRFDTWNYELERPLPKGKNKIVIRLMKDELGRKIIIELIYSYLIDDGDENKKARSTEMCGIKQKLNFKDDKNCLEAIQLEIEINHLENNTLDVDKLTDHEKSNRLILKSQQRLRSEIHNVFTEEINKIALSTADDKRMQSIGSIETLHRQKLNT